jgi:ribonucleoside-diphosphate reductase beta chain
VAENPAIWTAAFREELRELMREAVALEQRFIEDCLPVEGVGLDAGDFTAYIDHVADRRLAGVGLEPLRAVALENPLPWLAELMDVRREQNFFEGRVTEYQKASSLALVADEEL